MAVAGAAPAASRSSRFPGLTTQIFIGLLIGVVLGWLAPDFAVGIKPLADLFLRMIKMIIAPLLFSTLVVGIAGTGDLKTMGRIGFKAIVWFELATTVALVIGLVLVNSLKPGAGVTLPAGSDTAALAAMARQQHRDRQPDAMFQRGVERIQRLHRVASPGRPARAATPAQASPIAIATPVMVHAYGGDASTSSA